MSGVGRYAGAGREPTPALNMTGGAASAAARAPTRRTAEFSIPPNTPIDFAPPSATAPRDFRTPAEDFAELISKVEAGDPDDMLRYAIYLLQLSHRPGAEKWQQRQDLTEGLEWLEKAADKDHKNAMCIHIMASYTSYTSQPSDAPLPDYMNKANSYFQQLLQSEDLVYLPNLLTNIFTLTDPQKKKNVTDYLCTMLTQKIEEAENFLIPKLLGLWYATQSHSLPGTAYFICKIYAPMVLAHRLNTDLLVTFFTLFGRLQPTETLTTITSAQMIEASEICQKAEPDDNRLNFYLAMLYLIPTSLNPEAALITLKKCTVESISGNTEHLRQLYMRYIATAFTYVGTGTVTQKNAPLLPVLNHIRQNILAHCQLPADLTSGVETNVYWTRQGRKAIAEFVRKKKAAAKAATAAKLKAAAKPKAAPKAQPKRRTNNSTTAAAQTVRVAQTANLPAAPHTATGTGEGSIAPPAPTVRVQQAVRKAAGKARNVVLKKVGEALTGHKTPKVIRLKNHPELHALFSGHRPVETAIAKKSIIAELGAEAWTINDHVIKIKIPGQEIITAHVVHGHHDKKYLHPKTQRRLAAATAPVKAGKQEK